MARVGITGQHRVISPVLSQDDNRFTEITFTVHFVIEIKRMIEIVIDHLSSY